VLVFVLFCGVVWGVCLVVVVLLFFLCLFGFVCCLWIVERGGWFVSGWVWVRGGGRVFWGLFFCGGVVGPRPPQGNPRVRPIPPERWGPPPNHSKLKQDKNKAALSNRVVPESPRFGTNRLSVSWFPRSRPIRAPMLPRETIDSIGSDAPSGH